jgi:diaminopimelate dehydrogenase
MRRQRLAVIGFGRLGRACADAIAENQDLEPAGIVRRPGSPCTLATPSIPAVEHVRDLARVEAGLLCVPAMTTAGVACELLQQRVPIVECAMLEGGAMEAHFEAIAAAARLHRRAAVLGAGWDPGILALLRRAFEDSCPSSSCERRISSSAITGLDVSQ